ncbi:hypothetical protein EXM65_14585 [Clostridium botulinum]|uniref:Uncharacterized protein n=1 Tax=Clostridium botulinum TaxID=1491 RepID=A0A6M0SVH7_CLOBO|nr:hypothetical protein [Clostridium botulinum]
MQNITIIDKIKKIEYSILSDTILKLEKSLEAEGSNLNAIEITNEQLKELNKFKENISKIKEIVTLHESDGLKEWNLDSNFTNVKMAKLKIGQEEFECASYGKALAILSAWLVKDNRKKFEEIIKNRNSVFKEDANAFRASVKIEGTNIYVNTSMNSNNLVKIMKDIINSYGLTRDVKIIIA